MNEYDAPDGWVEIPYLTTRPILMDWYRPAPSQGRVFVPIWAYRLYLYDPDLLASATVAIKQDADLSDAIKSAVMIQAWDAVKLLVE